LTELVCVGSRIDFVVVGIGCNVNSRDFPADIPATSLRLLRAEQPPLDVRQLAEKLLAALDHFYRHYLQAGAAPIVEAFAAAAGLGEAHPPICVTTAGQTLRGVPIGLGRGGELLVRTAAGTVEVVHSGDVAMAQAPAASSQAAVAGYHNQGQIL
jgi:BirA family biotin operon repressor/biotin-[acetyl-CoA-carboxylase] ligase